MIQYYQVAIKQIEDNVYVILSDLPIICLIDSVMLG